MGTTADKLNRVLATKNELKAALIEKGQDPGDVFSQYPEKIRAIQTDSIKLSSIEITKQPNKVAYTAFESFNPEGMGVEANYSNGAHKALMPKGYKRVEYIESTGTQYIDTGFVYGPNNYQNIRMVADSTVGTAENGWAVSGIGAGVNFYYGCGRGGVIYYGCGGADSGTGTSYTYNRAIWDLDSKSARYKVTEKDSGIRLVNTSISVGAPTGDGSLFLFAYRQAGSSTAMCHIETLYDCKIYEDGILVRDFIPCINQNGEAGLFDLANNQFYSNAGSGAFVTGPELSSDGYEVTDGNSLTADQNHVTISYTEYGVTKTVSQEVSVQTIAANVPSVNESFTYTGSVLTPTWSNYDSSIMTIGGNTSGANAGTYSATFSLKDKVNYRWSDGSTSDKSVNWSIGKASVAIPTANSTSFTYNGSAATLSLSNYDSALVSASGISATNAGNYTATFALKDSNNYQWSDGTTANKTIAWVINKAQASVTLDKTSVILNADKPTDTVTFSTVGMKSVIAMSSDTNVATISVDGDVITISSVNETTGTANIILSGEVDSNYNAPEYPSIAVSAEFAVPATIFISFSRTGGASFRDYANVTIDGISYPLDESDLTTTALTVPIGTVITCKSNKTTLNGTTVASGSSEYQYKVVGDATISANISYTYNPMTGGVSSGDIAITEVSEGNAVVAITGSGLSTKCNVTVNEKRYYNTFLYVPFGTQVTCFVQKPDVSYPASIFLNGNEVSRDTDGSGVSYNYTANGNILIRMDSFSTGSAAKSYIYITEL